MTISMYQASVPVFIRMLTNLKGFWEKLPRTHRRRKSTNPYCSMRASIRTCSRW